MKKQLVLLLLVAGFVAATQAQQLLLNGKITFERSLNVHKDFTSDDDDDDQDESAWRAEYLKRLPKYKVDVYELKFSKTKTHFYLKTPDENPALGWYKTEGEFNQLSLLGMDSTYANLVIYDKKYVVVDSIAKPTWKLTGEYREIAGYMCRRATTILYDSVFVIAFYADAIPVSGGPDLYAGLPGMILGVVIPRFNFTLFASKVETAVITDEDFVLKPLKKSLRVSRLQLQEDLLKNTADWGAKYAPKFVLKTLFFH